MSIIQPSADKLVEALHKATSWTNAIECRRWISDNNPPPHLVAFWPTKSRSTSESDNHGVNCLFGQLMLLTVDGITNIRCVIRFKDCGSKSGYPICLNMFGNHGLSKDRYQVLDLIMPSTTTIMVFLEQNLTNDQVHEPTWYLISVQAPKKAQDSVRRIVNKPIDNKSRSRSDSPNWRSSKTQSFDDS